MVPRRVQGGGFLIAKVALGVVVVVVLRVLDVGLGVDAALRSSASARAAAWATSRRSSGDASHPTSETFSVRAGHGGVEVEDAPQPPT